MNRTLKKILILVPTFLVTLSILWTLLLKWCPVFFTPLIISRSIEYRADKTFHTKKHWVSLKRISPNLILAAIAAEDNRFEEHNGFDFDAIKRAIKDKKRGKRLRGASTISQQTAKNVFLWNGRSLIRKGLEAYFTFLIEKIWGKRRIMEVYLNVAEFGKGVYGAQAASQKFFKKDASKLTFNESALLVSVLPSPLKRNAGNPSAYLQQRASTIRSIMHKLPKPHIWGQTP